MYDYVIVGAGSAGAVLASRLSKDPEVTVALIEAGAPDSDDEIHLPVAFPALFKSVYDWDLDTEPEPSLYNRRVYLPRGKTLGGSSSMNAMIYIRGNRLDYDEWASGGATGWEYDDVLPYFKLAEGNERGEDDLHGAGGPLPVSEGRSLNPLGDSFLDAAEQAGYLRNPDFNGTTQLGVGHYQVTQRNGMRASTAVAYSGRSCSRSPYEMAPPGLIPCERAFGPGPAWSPVADGTSGPGAQRSQAMSSAGFRAVSLRASPSHLSSYGARHRHPIWSHSRSRKGPSP